MGIQQVGWIESPPVAQAQEAVIKDIDALLQRALTKTDEEVFKLKQKTVEDLNTLVDKIEKERDEAIDEAWKFKNELDKTRTRHKNELIQLKWEHKFDVGVMAFVALTAGRFLRK